MGMLSPQLHAGGYRSARGVSVNDDNDDDDDDSGIPPEKRRQMSRQTDDRFDFSGTQKQKKR